MRMPDRDAAGVSHAPMKVQRKCAACASDHGLCPDCAKEEEKIQAKEAPGQTPIVTPEMQTQIDSMRGGGQPLPESARTFFEPRFGRDFSRVRVHTNSHAAESANAVKARAYTVGRDIVFGAGQYVPVTSAGQRLLAHELTHVVQQNNQKREMGINGMIQRNTGRRRPRARTTARFGPDCGEFHRCSVIEPLRAARQMIDAVLAELPAVASGSATSGRIIDLLNVHFHTASQVDAQTILANFQQIRSELDAPILYNCRSDDPNACKSEKGFVGAETTCTANGNVLLCSAYFVAFDCEEQARMLIHEMAHHLSGACPDLAYVHEQNYMTLPPADAMRNADTYAQFAKMVHLGSINCPDCGLETQLRPGRY